MFNFGCRRYRISCAFGAAAYRSRQRRGELRHPKSKIQNPHTVGSCPTAGGNIEGLVVGRAGERRMRKFIFLLVTHTEIRHLGDT